MANASRSFFPCFLKKVNGVGWHGWLVQQNIFNQLESDTINARIDIFLRTQ
jgi:hypothetical protein